MTDTITFRSEETMYCGECGTQVTGNFCTNCGSPKAPKSPDQVVSPMDWENECNYETLIAIPDVRNRIARCSARSKKGVSAEEFLKLGDQVTSGLTGGFAVGKFGKAIQSFTSSLGIGMVRSEESSLGEPIGAVTVAVLCSLAEAGQTLRWVEQHSDGCEIDASLPSDMFSFEGDLMVRLTRRDEKTHLVATAKVYGQMYDLGKSSRSLIKLIRSVQENLQTTKT